MKISEINAQLATLEKQKEELLAQKRLLLFPHMLDYWLQEEHEQYKASFLEHIKVAPTIKENMEYGKHGSATKTIIITYTWDKELITATYIYSGYSDEIDRDICGKNVSCAQIEDDALNELPEEHRLAAILLASAEDISDCDYNYVDRSGDAEE